VTVDVLVPTLWRTALSFEFKFDVAGGQIRQTFKQQSSSDLTAKEPVSLTGMMIQTSESGSKVSSLNPTKPSASSTRRATSQRQCRQNAGPRDSSRRMRGAEPIQPLGRCLWHSARLCSKHETHLSIHKQPGALPNRSKMPMVLLASVKELGV
jgi:hypothetical protein